EKNVQKYLNFFPSAHISYEFKNSRTVQLSYSRRISRPHFWDLIPFYGYSDPRSFRSGNPELRPEYTDSYEIGHIKYWKKGSMTTSFYYRHRTGVEEDINVVDSTGYTRSFPVNMATQNAYGLEVTGSYRFNQDWDMNVDLNFYRAITDGSYKNRELHSDTYTMRGRISSKAKLPNNWEAQMTFNYKAPRKTTQGRRLSSYNLNFGISKKIMNEKGKLTLQGRDVFNTRVRRSITNTEDYYEKSKFQWQSRQIRLTFTYKLKGNDRSSKEEDYRK
ncbi:MAG: outer membrane beta-barrel family protein, partial [Flavobacteriales bacterium]